jgi:hypothetical protein
MKWFFLFLAAGILFWFIVFSYLKSYIKRRTGADYTLENLRKEIRLLEADIDTKTEQNLALLEEKIGELRQLCSETEKRITVYARELGRKTAEETALTALDRGSQEPPGLFAAPSLGSGRTPGSPASAGTQEKSPRKKAVPQSSDKRTSGRVSAGKKTPGRRKESSLLDSIEVREIAAGRAAGAYRAEARQARGSSVPSDGTEDPAPSEAPLPPEAAAPPRTARFVVSANPIGAKTPPMRERVAELYRAGFSEDLVAARLGISVTEARLYIAMASGRN